MQFGADAIGPDDVHPYSPPSASSQLFRPTISMFSCDHYSYASKGVPIIFFTTGLHRDYHYVTDEVDKIEFPKMAKIAALVYGTAAVSRISITSRPATTSAHASGRVRADGSRTRAVKARDTRNVNAEIAKIAELSRVASGLRPHSWIGRRLNHKRCMIFRAFVIGPSLDSMSREARPRTVTLRVSLRLGDLRVSVIALCIWVTEKRTLAVRC